MAQSNPPDNYKGPITFTRAFADEITGFLAPEPQLVRTRHTGYLQFGDDADLPGTDELRALHPRGVDTIHVEEPLE